jgi:lipid-A-disaccharide synthase
MLETAALMRQDLASIKFLILRSSTVKEEVFRRIMSRNKLPLCILHDMTYDGLAASDFAIVASGTATMETAILGVPMVILYKVSFFTWAYLRMAIKIPYIGMVNIIANQRIIPEFIQYKARPSRIAAYIKETLTTPLELDKIKKLLLEVKSRLGEKQAAKRAAAIVLNQLEKHENKSHTNN